MEKLRKNIKEEETMKKYLAMIMLACLLLAAGIVSVNAESAKASLQVVLLSQDPDPARPGSFVDIRFKVENNGTNPTNNLAFELQPEYPFSFVNPDDAIRNIGSLQAYQNGVDKAILLYRLKIADDAPAGTSRLKMQYRNGGTIYLPDDFDVQIESGEAILSVEKITTDPLKFVPGDTGQIKILIKNSGDKAIRDIKVKLDISDMPFTPQGSTDEKRIPSLDGTKSQEVVFSLITDADAESRIFKVPVNITYSDNSDNVYTKQNVFAVVVYKEPQYIKSLEETDIHTAGQKGNVVISVSNIGSTMLKFATLELLESPDYRILSPPVVYMGNLESDDFETAQFDIYVNPEVKDKVVLKTKLTYKDSYNDEYSDVKDTVQFTLYSPEDAMKYGIETAPSKTGPLVIAIIALVVVAYFGYRIWKRKKKSNGK